MSRISTPLLLTAHAICVLLFTHFCKDADNPGYWGIFYYLLDPLFFGLFALLFKFTCTDCHLNNSFIFVWGFLNIGRFIAYLGNYIGYVERTHNLQVLLLAIGVGTLFMIISGLRHGTFKSSNNG